MTRTLDVRFADALRPVNDESPAGSFLEDDSPTLRNLDEQRRQIDERLEQWLAEAQDGVPSGAGGAAEAEQLGAINARWFERAAGEAPRSHWLALQQRVGDALAHESKDLRLLQQFVEASAYGEGFPGIADALELAAAMIEQFWDSIHPVAADVGIFHDYLDVRRQALAWFNDPKEGLPYVVSTLPLSASPNDDQVTLRHLLAAPKRLPGWPTEAAIRGILGRTPPDARNATREAIGRCLDACGHLEHALAAKLASNGWGKLRDRLTQCRNLVGDVVSPAPAPGGDSLRLRLEAIQRLASDATSPRDAFIAELRAVDACLDADLYWVAAVLLEHLFTIVDAHELGSWESPELLARIHAAVNTCRSVAGTQGQTLPQLETIAARADLLPHPAAPAGTGKRQGNGETA